MRGTVYNEKIKLKCGDFGRWSSRKPIAKNANQKQKGSSRQQTADSRQQTADSRQQIADSR
jgi:hypothetical protein